MEIPNARLPGGVNRDALTLTSATPADGHSPTGVRLAQPIALNPMAPRGEDVL